MHLKASAVSELAETLFLQPKLSRRNLTKALDIGRENVATDLTQKQVEWATGGDSQVGVGLTDTRWLPPLGQAELDTFIAERKELYRDLDVAKQQARRYVNRWAFLGGLGGMAQFGGLAYFVYEVCSCPHLTCSPMSIVACYCLTKALLLHARCPGIPWSPSHTS